jgi:hypothetical protein
VRAPEGVDPSRTPTHLLLMSLSVAAAFHSYFGYVFTMTTQLSCFIALIHSHV